jgi:AcrR family transcriptional regulator
MSSMTSEGIALPAVGDRPERARDRIFRVAKDLFYRRGIRAVGVETIVAEAGATKMSLYRSFPSKDELIVAYLQDRDAKYWRWWDKVMAEHPNDPRQQLRDIFHALAARIVDVSYRGCAFTNAAVEFPEPAHPGRAVATANKQQLRARLRALSEAIGARDPRGLADQLVLLFEGAYSSSQTLGPTGPAATVADAAEAIIEAQLWR